MYVLDRGFSGDEPGYTPEALIINRTPEGFVTVPAVISGVGVQKYYAGEFPRDEIPEQYQDSPTREIHLLRSREEVFDGESVQSFNGLPLTNNHPPQMIDASNVKHYMVGISRDNTAEDKGRLKNDLRVMDGETLSDIEGGKQGVSCGYNMTILWTPGADPQRGAYDGVQTEIRGNHIAIVDEARGGPDMRIRLHDSWDGAHHESWDSLKAELGDGNPESENIKSKPKDKRMTKRKINGIDVEFDEGSVQAVDCLVTSLDERDTELQTTQTQLKDAQAEAETLKGQLAAETEKHNEKTINAELAKRFAAIDHLRQLDPKLEWEGKTPDQIRRELIKKHRPGIELKDATPEFVNGVFLTLEQDLQKSDKQKDGFRRAFASDAQPDSDDWSPEASRARVMDARKKMMASHSRRGRDEQQQVQEGGGE
jgi:hypothetical protein